MTNFMELGHHTTQHSGDEPVQEDVFWFPLHSTNKAIEACAKGRSKWMYQTIWNTFGVCQVEAKLLVLC